MSYAAFTTQCYGLATADFGGYSEGPSIRDNTHQRCGPIIFILLLTLPHKFQEKDKISYHGTTISNTLFNLISADLRKIFSKVKNAPGYASTSWL